MHDHHDHSHHDHGHGHDHHDHSHHGHDHDGHDHGAELRAAPTRRLWVAFGLTAGFLGVEAVAGVLTHSLALLSDAVHMLTDAGALLLAVMAQRMATRPRTPRQTYGYRRAETLAAFVNGIALAGSSLWIVKEALSRWQSPPEIQGRALLGVAFVGLLVNLASAWVLSRGSEAQNANTRAALAHVVSDAAGSVAAMVAGGLIAWKGWRWSDPLVSVAISLLVLRSAWRLLAETAGVLMESAPAHIDVLAVEKTVRETPGVAGFHDLHVWALADTLAAATVHVVLAPGAHGVEVASRVAERLRAEHAIAHSTVQPEAPESPLVTLQRKAPPRA